KIRDGAVEGAAPLSARVNQSIRSSGAVLRREAVDEHDDQGADDGEQDRPEAPRVLHDAADARATEETADETADDRPDDAEDDGGPKSHGLLAGHEGPSDETDERADDDP